MGTRTDLVLLCLGLFGCSSGSGQNTGSTGVGGGAATAICGKITPLPCSDYASVAECEADLKSEQESAQKDGCTAELDTLVNCYNTHPIQCDASGDLVAPACAQQGMAYGECGGSSSCIGGGSSTSCSYACDNVGAQCENVDSQWSCTCTQGPKTNQTFTSSEDPCNDAIVTANCG